MPYYLKVNYGANVVTAYKKDANGAYTVPVRAMVCSSGTATPRSGVYKLSTHYRWKILMGGVWGQYSTRIVNGILFHSVPYTAPQNNALKYKYYDKLGTKASAGCIRLTTADAYWIYSNCAAGTQVEFYSSSNPGPLGKPSAQKISGASPDLRCWDPTDPDPNNPWKKANNKPSTPSTNVQNNNKPNTNNQNANAINNNISGSGTQQKPTNTINKPTNTVQKPATNNIVNGI